MKTVRELIQHMKNKGIGFNILNEVEAEEHLNNHNNYFKLTAYRKNYTKYTSGSNKDKYERLEFAYLVELARIDAEIRSLLLDMALDNACAHGNCIINDLTHNKSSTVAPKTPQFWHNF